MTYQTKKYVTKMTTEWNLRGDVTVEQIDARIRIAVNEVMMTSEGGSGDYAFRGIDNELMMSTKEASEHYEFKLQQYAGEGRWLNVNQGFIDGLPETLPLFGGGVETVDIVEWLKNIYPMSSFRFVIVKGGK